MKLQDKNDHTASGVESEAQNGMKKSMKLTRREKEVLELVVKGLTAQQIAAKRFISLHTVESHKRNIIQKMGAKNTAQAVGKAMRMGLIK